MPNDSYLDILDKPSIEGVKLLPGRMWEDFNLTQEDSFFDMATKLAKYFPSQIPLLRKFVFHEYASRYKPSRDVYPYHCTNLCPLPNGDMLQVFWGFHQYNTTIVKHKTNGTVEINGNAYNRPIYSFMVTPQSRNAPHYVYASVNSYHRRNGFNFDNYSKNVVVLSQTMNPYTIHVTTYDITQPPNQEINYGGGRSKMIFAGEGNMNKYNCWRLWFWKSSDSNPVRRVFALGYDLNSGPTHNSIFAAFELNGLTLTPLTQTSDYCYVQNDQIRYNIQTPLYLGNNKFIIIPRTFASYINPDKSDIFIFDATTLQFTPTLIKDVVISGNTYPGSCTPLIDRANQKVYIFQVSKFMALDVPTLQWSVVKNYGYNLVNTVSSSMSWLDCDWDNRFTSTKKLVVTHTTGYNTSPSQMKKFIVDYVTGDVELDTTINIPLFQNRNAFGYGNQVYVNYNIIDQRQTTQHTYIPIFEMDIDILNNVPIDEWLTKYPGWPYGTIMIKRAGIPFTKIMFPTPTCNVPYGSIMDAYDNVTPDMKYLPLGVGYDFRMWDQTTLKPLDVDKICTKSDIGFFV